MIGAIFSIGKSLVGKLISKGGADVVGSILKGNPASEIAKASVEKEEIKAGRDVAVEQIRAQKDSWKDEYALLLISWPYLMLFALGSWAAIDAMFDNVSDPEEALRRFNLTIDQLANFPEWFAWLFGAAMTAALGIRVHAARNGGKK